MRGVCDLLYMKNTSVGSISRILINQTDGGEEGVHRSTQLEAQQEALAWQQNKLEFEWWTRQRRRLPSALLAISQTAFDMTQNLTGQQLDFLAKRDSKFLGATEAWIKTTLAHTVDG